MKTKICYLEFMFPIRDYFATLEIYEFIFDIIIPIIASTAFYLFLSKEINSEKIITFIGYIINLLAILIGFSITSVTIISSESSNKFDALRQINANRLLSGRKISLHQLILINYIFVIIVEFTTLVYNVIYYLLWMSSCLVCDNRILLTISIYLLLHIILLNIRNITNFYFIFWKR